jgi:peroxiredoxin
MPITLCLMNHMRCLIFLFSVLLCLQSGASPAEAQRIEKAYQVAMDKWSLEMRIATNLEAQSKIWDSRPDATPFARQMWGAISQSLDQEWTLGPAAWWIRTTPRLLATDANGSATPIFTQENETLRKAIETYHLKSLKLIPVCAALGFSPDQRSLSLLDKIQANHPDPRTQGVAALGAAMQLRNLGDDGEIMRRRLSYLRKAIIDSSDVELDGVTVAKIAEDELYIIRFLTKGRIAPDLVGVDSANRPISLSANQGKIIMLVFWNSNVPDAQRVVEITTTMEKRFVNQPLVVMGVNNDTLEKLRSLQADGTVPWTNFSDPENRLAKEYRVGSWPRVYVLDGERKIHYSGAPGSFANLTVEALLAEIKPSKTE